MSSTVSGTYMCRSICGEKEKEQMRGRKRVGGTRSALICANTMTNGKWLMTFNLANEDTLVLFKYSKGYYVEEVSNITQGGKFNFSVS